VTLLNPWVLFGLIPLYFIYKKHITSEPTRQHYLLYTALFFMIVAASRPALTQSSSEEKFNIQDYIIALDASYSMQADDLEPSRYIMAKKAIKKLFKLHPQDRFSIFAFTSNALLISPPTTDTMIGMQALDALNPEYILTKSTSLEHLFETVAKVSTKQKKLIVFSDGGDEHNIATLTSLLKKNNIIPYFVATGTQRGAALKKDGKYLKDAHAALVISRINPMLKDLANASSGKYYRFTSLDVIDTLSDDISSNADNKELTLKVTSYKELFTIPLAIALFLYFIAVTKIHQLYIFIPLLLLPYKSEAALLDFHYLCKANESFKEHKYHLSAVNFSKLEPSVKSYYNTGVAYYKAKEYKNALRYFTQIRTKDQKLKQALYYNIANCAVHLKKYDAAKDYYIKALALGEDADALYNLRLLQKMQLKTTKNLFTKNSTPKQEQQKENSKKEQKQKNAQSKNRGGSSNSNHKSIQSTNGGSGNKKKQKTAIIVKQKNKANKYKMAYKAYEIINKGYADEKKPW
jgi:Ca-activated chloride channel family protein